METTNGNRLNWLWGLILIFLGVAFLLAQTTGLVLGELVWTIIMAGIAATFLAVYVVNREQRWVLIPAYVFGALAGLLALVMLNMGNRFTPDLIPIYVLSAIGLPFLIVFLLDRRNWWALIPAYVMAAVVGLLLLESLPFVRSGSGDITGAYVLFAIALPFLVVFLLNPRNWWALIPGGIMLTIVFGLTANTFKLAIPAALIVAGLFLLVRTFRSERRSGEPVEAPRYGPEADRASRAPAPPAPPRTGPEADHE